MMFDEWPVWPRTCFLADAWLREKFDAALRPTHQARKCSKTLLAGVKSVQRALHQIDFDHPRMQWVLWIGGIILPTLFIIAVLV